MFIRPADRRLSAAFDSAVYEMVDALRDAVDWRTAWWMPRTTLATGGSSNSSD